MDDIGLSFATFRIHDPALGRWLQVDPLAEALYSYSPYNAMNNNPISLADPNGDSPLLAATGIGAGIGALSYTAGLLIQDGSLKNWNWGHFGGALVAGAVGGLVSPAITAAGYGGFTGGFVTGATSSAAGSITSGLINRNLSGQDVLLSTLYGGISGGLIQGIGAAIDGRNFWDGSKIEYLLIVEDANLNHVIQEGTHNCTCATGEMGIKAQGGSTSQKDIRSWMGGILN